MLFLLLLLLFVVVVVVLLDKCVRVSEYERTSVLRTKNVLVQYEGLIFDCGQSLGEVRLKQNSKTNKFKFFLMIWVV